MTKICENIEACPIINIYRREIIQKDQIISLYFTVNNLNLLCLLVKNYLYCIDSHTFSLVSNFYLEKSDNLYYILDEYENTNTLLLVTGLFIYNINL